jgi:hypothetical protein
MFFQTFLVTLFATIKAKNFAREAINETAVFHERFERTDKSHQ